MLAGKMAYVPGYHFILRLPNTRVGFGHNVLCGKTLNELLGDVDNH